MVVVLVVGVPRSGHRVSGGMDGRKTGGDEWAKAAEFTGAPEAKLWGRSIFEQQVSRGGNGGERGRSRMDVKEEVEDCRDMGEELGDEGLLPLEGQMNPRSKPGPGSIRRWVT